MSTTILNHDEIALKLDRIAWQILEQHYKEDTLVLVGLESRGASVADKIKERLVKFGSKKILSTSIKVKKQNPLEEAVVLTQSEIISNNAIILVDDVLNSGKTMAAALKEILNHNPESVKTAVLANRDHHKFPIQANYVGISLATTLKEHITFSEVEGKMSIDLS